jgi:hypothetical protein
MMKCEKEVIMPKNIKIPEANIRAHEERHKGLLLSEIAEIFIREIKRMSPHEKAELRKQIDQQNRCRRSNGTLRAWFETAAEAVAFAENPLNTAYHGDVAVQCLKPGCGGWHLSQPHWPDACVAAKAWIN